MVKERFLRYIKIDTQSNESNITCPSTKKQFDLLRLLEKELIEIGLDEVSLDENGYLFATLESNISKDVPTIGFIAHIDTAPTFSGKDVKPKIIEKYDGKDIILNKEKNIILKTNDFPELLNYIGQEIITTDGTTLLGADDKAGVAEIIESIKYIIDNDLEHGTIKIAFTPDEEIGRGADKFDVKKFNADYAYTIDGGEIGELEYENFNGASALITVNGVNVHPGSSKNKMKNAIRISMELDSLLPEFDRPEYTEDYEGFFHLLSINGDVEKIKMHYIIRDHFMDKFNDRKELIKKAVNYLNEKYPKGTVELRLEDAYYNMKEKISPVYYIVENAKQAMEEVSVNPIIVPIRGGTDGSKLSFMGLPTPNIFTGGHNFHGKFEFVPTNSMEKAVDVIVKIIELSIR
jgi:tripeptide aminopeptidase